MNEFVFDWDQLAFASKKPLKQLKATFVLAPRHMSEARLQQLAKDYLPKGNLVIGIAKEKYIEGFEGQPQFASLDLDDVLPLVKKIHQAKTPHKLYVLTYYQRNAVHILEKDLFARVLLINGSWKSAFHNRVEYYTLTSHQIPFAYLSPFVDENEAKSYEKKLSKQLDSIAPTHIETVLCTESEILYQAQQISLRSYDYCFQTGATLARKKGSKYQELVKAWNQVVPYETFALHHGSVREKNFSPPGDLNFYDTVHAEVELILSAQQSKLDIKHTTLFINLMPCPTCARMLCETDIAEVVYQYDHSEGYAITMLEAAGKTVRRVVGTPTMI